MEENQQPETDEGGESEEGAVGLADDRLYRCLAAQSRRRLLYYLLDTEEATVEELAEVLTGWDATEQGGMSTADDYKHVEISLRHTHLPALADAALVSHDPSTEAVTISEIDDSVAELLERSIAAEKS